MLKILEIIEYLLIFSCVTTILFINLNIDKFTIKEKSNFLVKVYNSKGKKWLIIFVIQVLMLVLNLFLQTRI